MMSTLPQQKYRLLTDTVVHNTYLVQAVLKEHSENYYCRYNPKTDKDTAHAIDVLHISYRT